MPLDTSRFEQFSSLMTGAAKSIAKLKAAQMEAFSLSGAHTSCLCRLYEAGSLTQGELTTLFPLGLLLDFGCSLVGWLRHDVLLLRQNHLDVARRRHVS